MNKPKLLITMGCSHTEGIGCWNEDTPNRKLSSEEYEKFHSLSKDNFYKKGWPNRLGNFFGFDEILNLASSGDSTSSNVKKWFEKYNNEFFKEYETTMIWLLPDSFRLSFYNNGTICNLNKEDKLWEEWLRYIRKIHLDSELEQLNLIKIMINECKLKNIKLILFAQETFFLHKLLSFDRINLFRSTLHDILNKDEKYVSKRCSHLNELGYEILSNDMINQLNDILDKPKVSKKVKKYRWDGDGISYDVNDINKKYDER